MMIIHSNFKKSMKELAERFELELHKKQDIYYAKIDESQMFMLDLLDPMMVFRIEYRTKQQEQKIVSQIVDINYYMVTDAIPGNTYRYKASDWIKSSNCWQYRL